MKTLWDLLESAAKAAPDAPALFEADREYTYGELLERAEALSAEAAVAPGERVAMVLRNSAFYAAAFFAASRAGGMAVPLNPSWDPATLGAALADSKPSWVWAEPDLLERVRRAAAEISLTAAVRAASFGSFAGAPKRTRRHHEDPSRPACILYTSGTEGRALGVVLTHAALVSNAESVAASLALSAADRGLAALPLCHVFGLSILLTHVVAGASAVIEKGFLYPEKVLETMEKKRVTGFSGVPSHYAILLDQAGLEKRRLPDLRYFAQAGDRMPESLTQRLRAAFPRKLIFLMYGQTEAGPRISCLDPERVGAKPASVGRALAGTEIRVALEDGSSCPRGDEGEILVKGPGLMTGYWNRPEETAAALSGGWLHTGDMGVIDAEGDLFITGRKRDFVKSGAHRVSLLTIERAALRCSGVADAAAVAVPDSLLGFRFRLYAVWRTGTHPDLAELEKCCRSTLAPYARPSEIRFVPNLPRNPQGKIDREKLAQLA